MKFLRSMIVMAATVCVAIAHVEAQGVKIAHDAGVMMMAEEADETPSGFLRRELQAGSDIGTTAPPPTTTAPPPTTTAPPPTTTAPPPTEPPTTAPPATEPPTSEPPATTTPSPESTEPSTTTPAPSPTGSVTNAPETTTAGPATVNPSSSGSDSSDGSNDSASSSSVDGAAADKLTDSSKSPSSTTTEDSKMSTGAIVGIVAGIVVGVAILAIIAVVLARKRREEDDDPLSPFELSMDKGYNNGGAAGGYGGQQSQYQGNNTGVAYSGARTANNSVAILGGAAAVGAGAGVGAAMMMDTNTPAAGADAAGVTYTQFYDPVTSPDSMYPPQHQAYDDRTNTTRTNESTTNESNLWMSAMEPKDNDIEGFSASVPPDVSLPADLNNSSFVSRNSYDELPGSSVDIDQSSVLSGGSDLEKDFPDYEDESSRGSYEL